jgi:HD-GYP domain-containing protein (c-di-GMP phosphodiesterase class II)
MEYSALEKDNSGLLNINVDLRETFFCIARALDDVGIDDFNHGHRVAFLAYSCARQMQWAESKCHFVFFLGLIHDCGVTQKPGVHRLMQDMTAEYIDDHCLRSANLLSSCTALSCMSVPIRHHHTAWHDLSTLPIGEDDQKFAALLFLADRVDYLRVTLSTDRYGNVSKETRRVISEQIGTLSGYFFEPSMVLAMQVLIDKEFIWFSMEERTIEQIAYGFDVSDYFPERFDLSNAIQLAELLANIVDAKSTFTYLHSKKVAQISGFLAKTLGLDLNMQKALYIAGLVHDLGKLHTPEEILHKPGVLDEQEYLCIQRHTSDTLYALQAMLGDSPLCFWAANHHERLDGSGYPKGLKGDQIDLPSRIVAIADYFQSLTQDRPYRGRLFLDEVLEILNQEVILGRLDQEVFAAIRQNAGYCYRLSICADMNFNV